MSEPVRVNLEQIRILRHALGHGSGQRNYFYADPGTPDHREIEDLVAMGLMVVEPRNQRAWTVTAAGFEFAVDMDGTGAQAKLFKSRALCR